MSGIAIAWAEVERYVNLLKGDWSSPSLMPVSDYPGFQGLYLEGSEQLTCYNVEKDVVGLLTWETSRHNGDAYGYKWKELDPGSGSAAVQNLLRTLSSRALSKELAAMDKEAEERRRKAAEARLAVKLAGGT